MGGTAGGCALDRAPSAVAPRRLAPKTSLPGGRASMTDHDSKIQRGAPPQTERLRLREAVLADASFLLELLNEPGWREHIGDLGVATPEDAERYVRRTLHGLYERLGFGLWVVESCASGEALGICGLIRRDGLDDVDLGFALLTRHQGHGYGREAAAACVEYAREALGLRRLVAISAPANEPSHRLLEALGFEDAGRVRLGADAEELRLFAKELAA